MSRQYISDEREPSTTRIGWQSYASQNVIYPSQVNLCTIKICKFVVHKRACGEILCTIYCICIFRVTLHINQEPWQRNPKSFCKSFKGRVPWEKEMQFCIRWALKLSVKWKWTMSHPSSIENFTLYMFVINSPLMTQARLYSVTFKMCGWSITLRSVPHVRIWLSSGWYFTHLKKLDCDMLLFLTYLCISHTHKQTPKCVSNLILKESHLTKNSKCRH